MQTCLKKFFIQKKYHNEILKISILGGILYYKKDFKLNYFEIRLLAIPIFSAKISKGFVKYLFLGLPILKRSITKTLYRIILNKIDSKKYNSIYTLFNCSGETYLFLSSIQPDDNSIFITTRKYHKNLCKMFHPDIKCVYLPQILNLQPWRNVYKEIYKGKTFYNVLPLSHFINLENKLQNGEKAHYYTEICKTTGIKPSNKALYPHISIETKENAMKKVKRIGLNLDNFVFICPESQSNKAPLNGFWNEKIEQLYSKGYDVFSNIIENKEIYGTAKTCFLTFEEAYYIASLSKEIIGLRSGFIEILSSLQNTPITCYYTDFKARGALKELDKNTVLEGFTLKKLPNTNPNNITEITVSND